MGASPVLYSINKNIKKYIYIGRTKILSPSINNSDHFTAIIKIKHKISLFNYSKEVGRER